MKLKFLLLVSLCTIALSACKNPSSSTVNTSAAPAETSTKASQPVSTQTTTTQAAAESSSASTSIDFNTLMGLVGKPDSEVVSVLGEGEPLKNDASKLINRDYMLSLFGENVSVSLYFNLYQEGTDQLEQCTINLNKPDLNGYEKILEGLLGKPSETHEKSYFFTTDTATVVLANPYDDVPYIEITPNSIQ